MMKRAICLFFTLLCLFGPISSVRLWAEETETDTVLLIAQGIINWKKLDNGSSIDGYLINNTYLELAGTTPGDWYPIGLGRLGISDDYAGYLAVIKDKVEERYRQSGRLSAAKATEWHRIALAVLAMGGDPTHIGIDSDGTPIDLIADGTYNRGKTTSLGRQGINGWIWGLIALDSMRYEIPADAYYTRDDIIVEILRQQLSDGGFALSGSVSDPDITAMAIQALAPYYNSEKVYVYQRKSIDDEVTQNVRQTVDEALNCLSAMQLSGGDYQSWGTQNVESTCQVVVALCCLGIDPMTDSRFIKNGHTLLDGILRYRMPDGGFIHSFTYDPDNPTSLPDQSNSMAGEQTLYTMAALWRQQNGMRTLYDFRAEQSEALRTSIAELTEEIQAAEGCTDPAVLEKLLAQYYSIPENERSYIRNYWMLSDAAKALGIDVEKIAGSTEVIVSSDDNLSESVLLYFSVADREAVDSLPISLTTEAYVTVVKLLDKLSQAEDFDQKDEYLQKLLSAKAQIAAIQAEIDSINEDILNELYPFDSISIFDKKTVDRIVQRYKALSEYDQQKINRWEDVVKTKTQIDNTLRGILIALTLSVIAVILTAFFIWHIHARRHRKAREMEALASMYNEDEND